MGRLVLTVMATLVGLALLGSCAGDRPSLGAIKPHTATTVFTSTTRVAGTASTVAGAESSTTVADASTTTAPPAAPTTPGSPTTSAGTSTGTGTGSSEADDPGPGSTSPTSTTSATGGPSTSRAAGSTTTAGAGSTTTAGAGSTTTAGAGPTTTSAGTAAPTTTAGSTSTTVAPPLRRSLGPDDLRGFIATPVGAPTVLAAPDPSAQAFSIPSKTSAGAPTTFAVVGDASPGAGQAHPGWFEVQLPTRPNGATGWVRASSVKLTKTPMRVFVDLGGRRVRVESAGKTVLDTTVAIGTSTNPTPTGGTFVTELIQNVKPDGTYGPFAFGLALHSDTLTEFQGGPGQVGIHGTNQPNLIGQAVSHGCIRLTNDAIRQMVGLQLPLGVPVFIS